MILSNKKINGNLPLTMKSHSKKRGRPIGSKNLKEKRLLLFYLYPKLSSHLNHSIIFRRSLLVQLSNLQLHLLTEKEVKL